MNLQLLSLTSATHSLPNLLMILDIRLAALAHAFLPPMRSTCKLKFPLVQATISLQYMIQCSCWTPRNSMAMMQRLNDVTQCKQQVDTLLVFNTDTSDMESPRADPEPLLDDAEESPQLSYAQDPLSRM